MVCLTLAGGVGGARMAHGLAMVLPPEELMVAVNIGDDFTHGRIQFVDAFLAKASRFGTGFGLWPGVSSQ